MKKANKNTPAEQENPKMPLTRRNYVLLAIGFAVILLGFVLMAGGGSDSPDQFNYAMFSMAPHHTGPDSGDRRIRDRNLRHPEKIQIIHATQGPAFAATTHNPAYP